MYLELITLISSLSDAQHQRKGTVRRSRHPDPGSEATCSRLFGFKKNSYINQQEPWIL